MKHIQIETKKLIGFVFSSFSCIFRFFHSLLAFMRPFFERTQPVMGSVFGLGVFFLVFICWASFSILSTVCGLLGTLNCRRLKTNVFFFVFPNVFRKHRKRNQVIKQKNTPCAQSAAGNAGHRQQAVTSRRWITKFGRETCNQRKNNSFNYM